MRQASLTTRAIGNMILYPMSVKTETVGHQSKRLVSKLPAVIFPL
jgi:hypothetical protein